MAELIEKTVSNEDDSPIKDYVYAIDRGVLTFQQSLWPKLGTVTHMDLSNNQLTCLPSSFGMLKNLTKLVLSQNELSTLPLSFAELNSLEFLDISHNHLISVPACFQAGVVKLSHLNISVNRIDDWRFGPMCGHALKYLNCSKNFLSANPSWLWMDFCHSLEELDLSQNFFSNASEVVKNYAVWRTGVNVRLKKLSMTQCGISSPQIKLIHQLKVLERLDIGNIPERKDECYSNCIWEISFSPFQCRGTLTELYLCGLGLSTLPDDINCLEVLEIINCAGNRLQWLPDSFSNLSNLRVAVFSQNLLLYLPNQFGNLCNLEELLLDSNQVGELPPSCSSLLKLRWLDLYKNHLEYLPSFIEDCVDHLSGLDLELNYFDPLSYVGISKVYPSLRASMHKHLHVVHRTKGLQETDAYSDYSSESNGLSDNESIELDSEQNSRERSSSAINTSHEDEEDWDLDEGKDDYYDPTVKLTRTYSPMPARALIIHEVLLHADSFLPSDIHPSPSIRANKNPFVPDDGQFEDIDDE